MATSSRSVGIVALAEPSVPLLSLSPPSLSSLLVSGAPLLSLALSSAVPPSSSLDASVLLPPLSSATAPVSWITTDTASGTAAAAEVCPSHCIARAAGAATSRTCADACLVPPPSCSCMSSGLPASTMGE